MLEIYASELRASLFGGFLTVATFLFAVKSFLVVTLQKDIYGNERYQEHVRQSAEEGLTEEGVYAPLMRLSRRLFFSTLLAFLVAMAQVTVGLLDSVWASGFCIFIALASSLDLGVIFWIQHEVIRDWLRFLQRESDKQFQASRASASLPTAGPTQSV